PGVGVLLDGLRAPAAQDLDRARAPDRRLGGGDDLHDRGVEVAADRPGAAPAPAAARRGAPRLRHRLVRRAAVAARHAGVDVRRGRVAEVAQDRLAAAAVALDELPDRPVLAPARPLGLPDAGLARRPRAAV